MLKSIAVTLSISLCACGSKPSDSPAAVVTHSGRQVSIGIYNAGTQDSASGTHYDMLEAVNATIPANVLRAQGSTDQNGLAVGVDFGSFQCYYNGSTGTPSLFTFSSCSNGDVPGSSLSLAQGQRITVWSYNHVNSSDSVVELLIQGESL